MKWSDINWNLVVHKVASFVAPPYCCCCRKDVNDDEIICSDCEQDIETLRVKKPRTRTLNGRRYRIHAVYQYSDDNAASTIVKRIKFLGKVSGIRFVGAKIAEKAMRLGRDYDAVTYVPMTRLGEFDRGFNQCEYISYWVSKVLNVDEYDLLKKVRNTKKQHKLSEVDRRTNLKGAFKAFDEAKGKRILLVDDVVTTGSTLCECAQELYNKGAESVTLIAFAMVKRNH